MSKKRAIDIMSIDDLSYMSDEDLSNRISKCESNIESGKGQDWEIELCYAQRESSLRENRKVAHEKYMTSLRENGQIELISDEFYYED